GPGLSIDAIGLDRTLILLIVRRSLGMPNGQRERQAGSRAHAIVLPPGSSSLVGITGAPMPAKIGDIITKLPHVAAVAPVLIQISTGGGHLQNLYGIDLATYENLHPCHCLSGGR